MRPHLGNCPFCGTDGNDDEKIFFQESNVVHKEGSYVSGYSIFCAECGVEIHDEYQDELVARWNGEKLPCRLEFEKTGRGVSIAKFSDRFQSECSLQASSLASEAAIWLGVDKPFNGGQGVRMHLTQRMVRDLLPALIRFANTGALEQEGGGE